MHTVKLDLKHGLVSVDSTPIAVDENGFLVTRIAKQCSPPIQTDDGRTQYRLLSKASVFGKSVDCLIEVREGRLSAVILLFDLIEFFETSILESKILKACEKSLNIEFKSSHPSSAFLACEWGEAIFFYDAKQGDLSLDITFQHMSD